MNTHGQSIREGKRRHSPRRLAAAWAGALALAASVTGCEVSGVYKDDNVEVQFGDTNTSVQVDSR